MAMMRAAVFTGAGGMESVGVQEVERPVPGPGQRLVRVRATALNRADLLQREGRYPPPAGAPRDIGGLEFAGELVDGGDDADSRFAAGVRVFGLIDGGAHAEFVAVPERLLMRIPDTLSFSDAAAVPEVFITAHDALVTQAHAVAGERVLIHAVASGVGTAAIQVARALDLVPYGTTRTAAKLDQVRALGLEDGVAIGDDFTALQRHVAEWSGEGMNIVLDLVGGPYLEASIPLLARRGRVVLIGTIAGAEARIPLGRVLQRRLTLRGTVLRARSIEEKAETTASFARDLMPALERGELKPVVDSRFALSDIRSAYLRMETNQSTGKIILEV